MSPARAILNRTIEILDGEDVVCVDTIESFITSNDLDPEEIVSIVTLAVGETYEAGGGASAEWSVRRVS